MGLNRCQLGRISFLIPNGFVGSLTRNAGDDALLFSTDKNNTIELRIERDCEELKQELTIVVRELGKKIIQPVSVIEVNNISGYCAAYSGCRTWYYEAWMDLKDCALRVIIRSCADMGIADAEACFRALDIQVE